MDCDVEESVRVIMTISGSCCMGLYIKHVYILYINKCWWFKETGVLIREGKIARKHID